MTMMLVAPTSAHARGEWLLTVTEELARDVALGRNLIPGGLHNQLSNLNTNFQQAEAAHKAAYAERRAAVHAHKTRVMELRELVKAGYRTLLSLRRRGLLTTADFENYKLPEDGIFPNSTRYARWRSLAEEMAKGMSSAEALGLPTLPDPSLEILQAKIDAVTAAQTALALAKQAVKEAAATRAGLRASVNLHWRKTAGILRSELVDQDAAARREQMRRYGFIFRGSATETGSTDDTGTGTGVDTGNPDTTGDSGDTGTETGDQQTTTSEGSTDTGGGQPNDETTTSETTETTTEMEEVTIG